MYVSYKSDSYPQAARNLRSFFFQEAVISYYVSELVRILAPSNTSLCYMNSS